MSKPKRKHFQVETAAASASPQKLAETHLSLVVPIARSFRKRLPSSVDFNDLVGAGSLGLVEAARRFNSDQGTSFGTFARHRIRGAITDSLRQIDPVSRSLRTQHKRAEQANTDLMTKLGRHPTEAETAKRLGLSLRRWRKLSCELYESGCPVNGYPLSRAAIPPDVDKLPGALADPERLAELAEARSILDGAIGTLPTRDQNVLRLYHFEEWTMKQIADMLCIDESRVSQIRAAALRRLRDQLAPVLRHPT